MPKKNAVCLTLALLVSGLVTIPAAWGLSLADAVEQSAKKIVEELPPKSRVAIVAFESPNDNLSNYIMEELTGALFERGIEVADRRNLDYVYKELKFQMSGEVSEKSAQSIGKFLGVQLVITGQLASQGKNYRYRASAIHVEKATLASVTRLDVENNKAMQNLVTAMSKQKNVTVTAKYGVDEKTVPKTTGTFLDRGILFASRRDYELAIMDFTAAIKLEPNLAAAYMLRGRALTASVLDVSEIKDNFSGIEVFSTGGRVSAEQKKVLELSLADYTQAMKFDQNNAVLYKERGDVYDGMGESDKAIADFNQALRLNPNYAVVYRDRAMVYSHKGEHDKAIADTSQAIKLEPDNANWYNARGTAYSYKGDYDRAITDYTQAIKLEPNNAGAYSNRGSAYNSKGNYDRAIADYSQAIRLDPNDAVLYNNRGNAYYNKKDYDRAIADCTQAIKLDPNKAVAYNNRGFAYGRKGDYDRAIADLTQAIKLAPNNARAYSNRGGTYYDKGDYDRAIADFEAALRLEPNNARVREALEIVRRARGR
jgi:tetratricopeptide (TPR) repeat protein